jgi:uncharacterized membrane protein YbhN (UPF0104 family)
MLKKLRPYISIGLLVIALGLAVLFIHKHKNLLTQLGNTPLSVGLIVLGLYIVMFAALMLKFSATLKVCNIKLKNDENAKLNAHTLLINFFIPGQGGPIYTGIYLFKKYKLKVKNFILATILYYIIYALISVGLLLAGSRPLWQTIASILIVGGAGTFAAKRYMNKANIGKESLNLRFPAITWLTLATLFQAIVQVVIYAVELKSVNHHIRLSQIITYTGAANLALFASLTPGAIGIRESFLIFTEKLNHLSSSNIVLASLIDRSVYLVFLGLIIIVTLILHVNVWSVGKRKNSLELKGYGSVNGKP